MKYAFVKRALLAIALAACSLPHIVHAQYVWLDEKGVKQYSDMPPPSSVPGSRILKHPGANPPAGSAVPETAMAPAKAETTTAEKNAEFRKRRLEQAEKEKKAAEETKLAADKARYCERAQEYNKALNSGERSFLTDEQRAQEQRDTRRMLEDCK